MFGLSDKINNLQTKLSIFQQTKLSIFQADRDGICPYAR